MGSLLTRQSLLGVDPDPGRPADVPVWCYCAAHFGKSLWWNGSELYLLFFLTERLCLPAAQAAVIVALGLLAAAAFDLALSKRLSGLLSPSDAGRLQLVGQVGSIAALAIFAAAAALAADWQYIMVLPASLLLRFSYTLYDLPQNCLLSLLNWTSAQRRIAAAGRTAASAMSIIAISLYPIFSMLVPRVWSLEFLSVIVAIGLVTSFSTSLMLCLLAKSSRVRSNRHQTHKLMIPAWPFLLMIVACLTVATFSKLIVYVVAYGEFQIWDRLPLLVVGSFTVASQPVWLRVASMRGERFLAGVSAALLLISATLLAAVGSTPSLMTACALIGAAGGGLATAIWSAVARCAAEQIDADLPVAYAKLTAAAKASLAISALIVGVLLDHAFSRNRAIDVLPFLGAVIAFGGGLCGLSLLRKSLPHSQTAASLNQS